MVVRYLSLGDILEILKCDLVTRMLWRGSTDIEKVGSRIQQCNE